MSTNSSRTMSSSPAGSALLGQTHMMRGGPANSHRSPDLSLSGPEPSPRNQLHREAGDYTGGSEKPATTTLEQELYEVPELQELASMDPISPCSRCSLHSAADSHQECKTLPTQSGDMFIKEDDQDDFSSGNGNRENRPPSAIPYILTLKFLTPSGPGFTRKGTLSNNEPWNQREEITLPLARHRGATTFAWSLGPAQTPTSPRTSTTTSTPPFLRLNRAAGAEASSPSSCESDSPRKTKHKEKRARSLPDLDADMPQSKRTRLSERPTKDGHASDSPNRGRQRSASRFSSSSYSEPGVREPKPEHGSRLSQSGGSTIKEPPVAGQTRTIQLPASDQHKVFKEVFGAACFRRFTYCDRASLAARALRSSRLPYLASSGMKSLSRARFSLWQSPRSTEKTKTMHGVARRRSPTCA